MTRVVALDEKNALLGVQAGGQKLGEELIGLIPQRFGILPDGDGVQIRNAIAIVEGIAVLNVDPVLD